MNLRYSFSAHCFIFTTLLLLPNVACRKVAPVDWNNSADAAAAKSGPKSAEDAPQVRLIAPQAQADSSALHATGVVRSLHDAILSAPTTGTIRAFLVDTGDRVKAGQALVELDPVLAQAQATQARAARDRAQAELHKADQALQRAQVLHEAQSASQASFEISQAAFEGAEAELLRAKGGLQAAEKLLRDTTVRAPFAGIIAARHHERGEVVTQVPTTELLHLVDDAHLEVRLGIPEVLIDGLRPGTQVQGTVSPTGKAFTAVTRVIGSVVDPVSHTVEVLATVQKSDGLRAGALVDVCVGDASAMAGAFLPRQVLHGSADDAYVWIVDNGRVQRQDIKAEPITQDTIRVLEGINRDTRVILADTQLREGQEVRVVD